MMEWGINGYPQVVPGTNYAACTVWANGEQRWTDIYPFMDNPNFEWRTIENSPWLTEAECETINAPHRKRFWMKEARTFAVDPDARMARNKASDLLNMEPVHKHRYFHPDKSIHTRFGGYVPYTTYEFLAEKNR